MEDLALARQIELRANEERVTGDCGYKRPLQIDKVSVAHVHGRVCATRVHESYLCERRFERFFARQVKHEDDDASRRGAVAALELLWLAHDL